MTANTGGGAQPGRATSSHAAPAPAGATCRHCAAPDYAHEYYESFKVSVCQTCFRRHERLMNKSNAKATYLLSDSDLYPLGNIEKPNPRNQKFANMKQYLVSQLEEVAIAKHGSLEALEVEKQRRMQGKLEARLQKRQAAEEEEEREQRRAAILQATLDKYATFEGQEDDDDDDDGQPEAGEGDPGGGGGGGSVRKKNKTKRQRASSVEVEIDLSGVEVEEF